MESSLDFVKFVLGPLLLQRYANLSKARNKLRDVVWIWMFNSSKAKGTNLNFVARFSSTTVAARPTHVTREKQTESQQLPDLLSVAEEPHVCVLQTSLV